MVGSPQETSGELKARLVSEIDSQRRAIDAGSESLATEFRERTDLRSRVRSSAHRWVVQHPVATVGTGLVVGWFAARALFPSSGKGGEKTASHLGFSKLGVGSLFGLVGRVAIKAARPWVENAISEGLATGLGQMAKPERPGTHQESPTATDLNLPRS